jgi:putative nucleotidyltransferase with HDIG domain
MSGRERTALSLSLLQLAGAAVLVVVLRDVGAWDPVILTLLTAFALIGDRLEVNTKVVTVSGAFLAVGLAMVLLGPVPAALVGALTIGADSARRRPAAWRIASNLSTFTVFPLLGGWLVHELAGKWHVSQSDVNFSLIVIGVFVLANGLNFVQVAITHKIVDRISILKATTSFYLPVLPSQVAVGALAAAIIYAHAHGGGVALGLLVGVVVLYQYLLRELLLSKERAEQLGARTKQLASLQVGVLTAMLQTLSLRDKMTARHCAAVARYAREIAREAGRSEEEQELVHTAGLLHDIGKFIFPDHILLANRKLDDADWEIVKKHPAQGARVVRQVDGYGPIADIILAHHERIDGKGYPNGLAGEEIPLLSRMISIADTYDVMTARDSYREPVSPAEAIEELIRVSDAQLDAELVQVFLRVLERKGVAFHHADDADFETELDMERRVREFAEPRSASAA